MSLLIFHDIENKHFPNEKQSLCLSHSFRHRTFYLINFLFNLQWNCFSIYWSMQICIQNLSRRSLDLASASTKSRVVSEVYRHRPDKYSGLTHRTRFLFFSRKLVVFNFCQVKQLYDLFTTDWPATVLLWSNKHHKLHWNDHLVACWIGLKILRAKWIHFHKVHYNECL